MIRKMQAAGLELLLALACVLAGVASIIPNKGLLYTLMHDTPYSRIASLAMVLIGICGCWAAIRPKRWLRVGVAYAANGVWLSVVVVYVTNDQLGLVLFLSILFFAFNCFVAHEHWE